MFSSKPNCVRLAAHQLSEQIADAAATWAYSGCLLSGQEHYSRYVGRRAGCLDAWLMKSQHPVTLKQLFQHLNLQVWITNGSRSFDPQILTSQSNRDLPNTHKHTQTSPKKIPCAWRTTSESSVPAWVTHPCSLLCIHPMPPLTGHPIKFECSYFHGSSQCFHAVLQCYIFNPKKLKNIECSDSVWRRGGAC